MPTNPTHGYSTIYHLPFGNRETRDNIVFSDNTPTQATFKKVYNPVETILGVTDKSQAYYHAQGRTVNEFQNSRHMVRSASVGDIIEIVNPPSDREFYLINSIGFTKLDFETTSQQ